MLIESRPPTTEGEAVSDANARVQFLGGVRSRVLVSFLALLVLSTAASVLVLRQVLMSRISDQVRTELTQDLQALQELAAGQPDTGRPWPNIETLLAAFLDRQAPPSDGLLAACVEGAACEIVSAGRGVSESGLPQAISTVHDGPASESGTVDTGRGEAVWLAISATVGDDDATVFAAELTAAERNQVEDAVRLSIGVSIVVLLLASLFIWLAAGRAVAPLQALSRTARTISETDLSGRIPVSGGDEIAELGHTFNRMLDRLETAFADQKDFLSDVSHELRTPITVIRGHIETLGDSPAERHEAIAVIQDELDRMSRYVDDLLVLTKAPRPDFLRLGPIDLDLFTHDLLAKARSLGDRDWRLDGNGVGILVADQQRLTQAVMNLAENAVRHTLAAETIWLGSSLIGETARLWVRDEGPGVSASDRERIFARFARGDTASQTSGEGAGLGLSIVRAIADAHGGQVELDSRPGMGSTFTIVVPAAAKP